MLDELQYSAVPTHVLPHENVYFFAVSFSRFMPSLFVEVDFFANVVGQLSFLYRKTLFQDCSHREIFLQTLICNVPFNSRRRLLQFDPPVAQDSGIPQIDKVTEFPLPNVVVNGRNGTPSPYPEIDRFFQCIVSRDCLNGYIRQWQHFPQTDSLVYIISGQYKFCERIGRHHKSNNILFVAHVSAGMYHQKCLDPECRAVNYRSRDYLLPCLRLPEINTGEAPYAGAETAISRAGNLRPPLHTLGDDADEHEFISSLPMDIFEDQ